MVERQFAEPRLAALYDPLCGRERRTDFRFYLPLVMAAKAVLDVGCGTGALLHWARETGHAGRLVGLDPARGMLDMARTRADIEWVFGDLRTVAWEREFDLAVMTGHAFQQLVEDDEIRASLASIHSSLADDGVFAFETRNPLAREWERWTPDRGVDFVGPDGVMVRFEARVDAPVSGDVVRFTCTYTSAGWNQPEPSRAILRFLDAETLAAFLADAGFAIEDQFGDWDRSTLVDTSPEIITIARRAQL
ncbi:MAG: class I SAM-dependent methyltransferase [Spirochaetaceae bacterium]|nr:class I SAM-dependent methyltransferase [Spirochaetaceae bacterium]